MSFTTTFHKTTNPWIQGYLPSKLDPINTQNQRDVFLYDLNLTIAHTINHLTSKIFYSIQYTFSFGLSFFDIFHEIYKYTTTREPIDPEKKTLSLISLSMIYAVSSVALHILSLASIDTLQIVTNPVGLLAWHGGEKILNVLQKSSDTRLPENPIARDMIYTILGSIILKKIRNFSIPISRKQFVILFLAKTALTYIVKTLSPMLEYREPIYSVIDQKSEDESLQMYKECWTPIFQQMNRSPEEKKQMHVLAEKWARSLIKITHFLP